ncbi:MAG: MMPL family transporter [Actinomycetota bacterium]
MHPESDSNQQTAVSRLTGRLADRPGVVIAAVLVVTALLAIPFLAMQPTESASQEPTGEVFEARDRIEERFASSVFTTFTVVEDRDGDILRVEPLTELLTNAEALRSDADLRPTLFGYYDVDEDLDVLGLLTIADLIDARLPGGLAGADDAAVKAVAAELIAERGVVELGLSAQTETGPDGPVSPATLIPVLSDDTVLGFGGAGVRLGTGTESETYSREVVDALRGDEDRIQAWGVAIDVNLTAEEEGQAAGPFIGFTIAAVLAIVGLTFRSYWVLAVTGGALATLIIWLNGITNLLGLKEDLILTLIVPIAMISFGVDFAFHSIGRYREQRSAGLRPRAAFGTGLAAVGGALVLALASDSAAFLSNTSAGIESIVQFGLGAAVALVAAFILLGVVTPLGIMMVEDKVGSPTPTRGRRIGAVLGSIGAAQLAMASVLFSVFILPAVGLVLLAVYLLVAIVLPYRLARRADESTDGQLAAVNGAEGIGEPTVGRGAAAVGAVVAGLARRPIPVLAIVAAVTIGAGTLAVQVPTEFDVKDFFSAESDFVVGLDKLDEHGGEQAGEPADILIEADLTDPATVARIQGFVDEFEALDTERFARTDAGDLNLEGGLFQVIDEVWAQPAAQGAIAAITGVTLTDADGDGLPDDSAQLAAVLTTARSIGVPITEDRVALTADQVRSGVWLADDDQAVDGPSSATRFSIGLPGSRQVENIVAARDELTPLVDSLEADLQAIDADAAVTVTGGPIARQESLDATSRALQVSLPIAVAICLLIAATFMRSLRLAVIVIIPILIVVAWLYAFMFVFGFAVNLVTATIGAVSIGIGIDFAIHFTERYREELERRGTAAAAVRAAGEGTGTALVASALSSIVGFAILALAPMPLFASYGFLTAVMIAMALVASLAVLPSMLVLTTRDGGSRSAAPDHQSKQSISVPSGSVQTRSPSGV